MWALVERGKGSVEDDPRFPNQTTGLKCHSVLWYRDLVSKEVAVRSLLDMLSVTYLGSGTSKWRHLVGS